MIWRHIVISALCGLLLAGCADDAPYLEPGLTHHNSGDYTVIDHDGKVEIGETQDGYLYFAKTPTVYRLDSGDKVRVDVFGQRDLSRIFSVDGGGFISLPLIGAIKARGRTTYDLERIIANELSREFIRDPKVNVEINTYRPFFILGEVRSPGKFPYENAMTVQTAVAIAGGYTPRASERYATVTRLLKGRRVTIEVPMNFPVKPGDTIRIEERFL